MDLISLLAFFYDISLLEWPLNCLDEIRNLTKQKLNLVNDLNNYPLAVCALGKYDVNTAARGSFNPQNTINH